MALSSFILCLILASATTAFQPFSSFIITKRTPHPSTLSFTQLHSSLANAADVTENAQRDINSLYQWGANYGVQTSDCFELSTQDGLDVFAITNQNLPAESPIVCVPRDLILSGGKARQEYGMEAAAAERAIKQSDHTEFYLFLKVLKEYELGEQSPWYTWLNSLPRFFSNAASMTDFCYSCLPPYAAKVSKVEKFQLKRFQLALDEVNFISDSVTANPDITKWAYNVVHTRYHETPGGDYVLVPMGDYFNHGGTEEVDAYISYDEQGNFYAYSTRDCVAGQPLRICYGDPTNPSQILAKYGFLAMTSQSTYCKWIAEEPSSELFNLGYPSRMLFYGDGGISPEVWDVLLYQELGLVGYNEQQAFYQAHVNGDEATKASYHQQYFPQTFNALQSHVSYLLGELDELATWQSTKMDTTRHPRLPLIMQHNNYVQGILQLVQQNLYSMSG